MESRTCSFETGDMCNSGEQRKGLKIAAQALAVRGSEWCLEILGPQDAAASPWQNPALLLPSSKLPDKECVSFLRPLVILETRQERERECVANILVFSLPLSWQFLSFSECCQCDDLCNTYTYTYAHTRSHVQSNRGALSAFSQGHTAKSP